MEETYDIFVGSLLSSATQESVTKLFEKFGRIVKVKVLDKTSAKGLKFAFVHYDKEEHALKAIEEMNDYMHNGVPLQVRKSDRWLTRTGEEKLHPKGSNFKRPKNHTNIAENIGMWQPSDSGNKGFGKNYTDSKPNLHGCLPKQENMNKVLKERIAITHVEDPVTFYAYFASKNAELDELAQTLQNVCPGLNPINGEPVQNQIYASKYSADNQWYRCKVTSVDKIVKTSSVQYIDFGNTETVCYNSLVELPPKLQILSPFSMKCVFKNLTPYQSNPSYYQEAIHYLKSALIDQIVLAVLHVLGNGGVLLVSEIQQNGLNIVDYMLKKGYVAHNFSVENNRNYLTHNGKVTGGGGGLTQQCNMNDKSRKKLSPDPTSPPNFNALAVTQERDRLLAENKKLKYENAQAKGRHMALQTELDSLHQTISQPNPFSELTSVITNIEKVRRLRQQLPVKPNSVDYIDVAVSLLSKQGDALKPLNKDHRDLIQSNVVHYHNIQEQILNCTDKDQLDDLIKKRNELRGQVSEELRLFCTAINSDEVQQRLESFKTALTEIRKIYKPFLNMDTFGDTAAVEELHNFYTSTKSEKAEEFLVIQRKTDMSHRNFFAAFQPFSMSLEKNVEIVSLPELTQLFIELQDCLEEELKMCNMEESSEANIVGVMTNLLCKQLESELAATEEIRFLDKQYSNLLDSWSSGCMEFPPPSVNQLSEKRKERKKLKSQLRHILADKMDLEESEEASDLEASVINEKLKEVRCKLHSTFLEEDKLIVHLAHLQKNVLPELQNQYPDFGLAEYNRFKGHVKSGLEIEHFDLNPQTALLPSDTQYSSTFVEKPVRLQEYQLSSDTEKEELLDLIVQYSAITHPHLLPVDAVFFTKKCVHAYVQQPLFPTLLSIVDSSERLYPSEILAILKGVLQALAQLHGRGLLHGRIHPASIYFSPSKDVIVNSISFQPYKSSGYLPQVNGIQFRLTTGEDQLTTADDIYSFACLLLWLAFPKTEFEFTESGIPILRNLDLDPFRMQILELVQQIFESPVNNFTAADILNHPTLNQDPEMYQVMDLPVPNTDSPDVDFDDASCELLPKVPLEDSDNSEFSEDYCKEDSSNHGTLLNEVEDSGEDETDMSAVLEAFDSVRLNQCSLGLSEAVQNG